MKLILTIALASTQATIHRGKIAIRFYLAYNIYMNSIYQMEFKKSQERF